MAKIVTSELPFSFVGFTIKNINGKLYIAHSCAYHCINEYPCILLIVIHQNKCKFPQTFTIESKTIAYSSKSLQKGDKKFYNHFLVGSAAPSKSM